jgi:transmembrane sensor
MSKDDVIRNAIAQRAADWFVAHRAGELDQAEREAFFAWLKASPIHVEEYLGIAAAERGLSEGAAELPKMALEDLKKLAREDDSGQVIGLIGAAPAAPAVTPTPRKRSWMPAAAAAGVTAAAVAAAWLLQAHSPAVAQTFRTARGAQQSWQLTDGSSVRLDSDSEVSVLLSASERVATVVHGQALFHVAHDAHRSFRVRSGNVDALAIGTEFDVYQKPESTLITVLEGQIAVSDSAAQPGNSRALKVSTGEQVRINAGAALPAAAVPADIHTTMSWLDHKISFDQRPLAEVADEFNRYNAAQIMIEDPSLRRLPVSGVFDAADIDSFAAFLASLEGVGVTRNASAITVWRRNHGGVLPRAKPGR